MSAERNFLHRNPALQTIPADSRLYIIARPHLNRSGFAYHFYLQKNNDETAIFKFNTLKALQSELAVTYSRDQTLFKMWCGYALQGEEEKRYLHTHSVLSRIPHTHRLYIIARPHTNRNGNQICFFLQKTDDKDDVEHFERLEDISTLLDDGYSREQQRFENALPFAMHSPEEQSYVDKHPVLARIPAPYRLYIIDRGSRRISFWLQSVADTRVLKFYKSLDSITLALLSARGSEIPACIGRTEKDRERERERERMRVRVRK